MTILSMIECAKLTNVTKGAIKAAIRNKRLPAERKGNQWYITLEDLQKYRKEKHSRDCSTFNGEPLINKEKGEYSIHQSAKLLNCPYHHIYHAIRKKRLKSFRKKFTWIIHIDDLMEYRKVMKVISHTKTKLEGKRGVGT